MPTRSRAPGPCGDDERRRRRQVAGRVCGDLARRDRGDPRRARPDARTQASVLQALSGVAAEVRLLALPDPPPKGDVSDWIAAEVAAGRDAAGLGQELMRLAAGVVPTPAPAAAPQVGGGPSGVRSRCMAEAPEAVILLWFPYLPLRKLTLLEGDPRQGKTGWQRRSPPARFGRGLPGMRTFAPFPLALLPRPKGWETRSGRGSMRWRPICGWSTATTSRCTWTRRRREIHGAAAAARDHRSRRRLPRDADRHLPRQRGARRAAPAGRHGRGPPLPCWACGASTSSRAAGQGQHRLLRGGEVGAAPRGRRRGMRERARARPDRGATLTWRRGAAGTASTRDASVGPGEEPAPRRGPPRGRCRGFRALAFLLDPGRGAGGGARRRRGEAGGISERTMRRVKSREGIEAEEGAVRRGGACGSGRCARGAEGCQGCQN